MHAISSYRGNRLTHPHTHTHTHKQTGPITIHCAAASTQCNQQNRMKKKHLERVQNSAKASATLTYLDPNHLQNLTRNKSIVPSRTMHTGSLQNLINILQKLRHMEAPEFVTRWIHSFLFNRQQRVTLDIVYYDWLQLNGGMLQGSWFGSYLFLVLIDDLFQKLNATTPTLKLICTLPIMPYTTCRQFKVDGHF